MISHASRKFYTISAATVMERACLLTRAALIITNQVKRRVPVLCSLAFLLFTPPTQADELLTNIPPKKNRTWIAPQFWANRLQDWKLQNGRAECLAEAPRLGMRTLHLLTHRLNVSKGKFSISCEMGLFAHNNTKVGMKAAGGFLIGVGGKKMDYRAAAIVHQFRGHGAGIFAGVDATGEPFIHDFEKPLPKIMLANGNLLKTIKLELTGESLPNGKYRLILTAGRKDIATATRAMKTFPASRIVGNIALVSHPGNRTANRNPGRFWFKNLKIIGDKISNYPNRTFGPIVSTQYTLSRNVLKLTAQMMPLGKTDNQTVKLEVEVAEGDGWSTIAVTKIVTPGYIAPFRIPDWNSTKDQKYRVVYENTESGNTPTQYEWNGTIRKDPVNKETIVVAGFTGNHNNSHRIGKRKGTDWPNIMWFPHSEVTQHVALHQPDVLFFSGDQVYEGKSPTFPDSKHIMLDYLYKWYLWCWAYRDLTKDIPAVTIPDDHDVYQGNVWGEGGRATKVIEAGGYRHPAEFVKMVDRTQTSHLPDPFDPTPIKQGIGVYYCDMVYGRISFAVIEDRKFKSGCAHRLPPTGTKRFDHINNPNFDVMKADVPGLKLLGDRQLKFLRHWAGDWKGADMKMAMSQTVFANMATHHGPNLQYLIADLDSNGWPQTGRRKALEELRRGFAPHLCGDQHLAMIVHHGTANFNDSSWSFCVPSVANFYPRKWAPKVAGKNRPPGSPPWMGEHLDGFKNKVTVYAAANPGGKPSGHRPSDLHDKMPGYGIVKLNKKDRTITFECWPRYADPRNPADKQYPGWPKTIRQTDNYARKATGYLPTLKITGIEKPVVTIIDEATGELVYALRIKGTTFRPKVFRKGKYTIKISNPDIGMEKVLKGVESGGLDDRRRVDLS